MKISPLFMVVGLVMITLVCVPAARADESGDRDPSAEIGLIMVPYGMNYLRVALGVTAKYQIPLIEKPGVLWETSNVTVGLRNLHGFVNNTTGAFIEVTPIAVFKLRVTASYDRMIVNPFDGGVRVLTDNGRALLAQGRIERGNDDAIDWVDGQNNSAVFRDPIGGGGLRLKIQPTLQARFGPIAVQYNFLADINRYSAGDADTTDGDDVYHDTYTFTLRQLHDRSFGHDVLIAYDAPREPGQLLPGEVLAGLRLSYTKVSGTELDNVGLLAVLRYRPDVAWFGDRWKPWTIAQLGTHLSDPMHQYDFAWVLALGVDISML